MGALLALIDAAGEVLEEGLLAQLGEAAGLHYTGICRWEIGSQCRIVLAGIRRASSDVNKGRDNRINARFADDCSLRDCAGVVWWVCEWSCHFSLCSRWRLIFAPYRHR